MRNQLFNLRKKIDRIDDKMLVLLGRRMSVVKKIGKFKKKNKLPILDKVRFDRVLADRKLKGRSLGLHNNLIQKIFEAIHEEALHIEDTI